MQASKVSYQLALVPMGEDQPPATLLRLGFSTKRVSLVMRQVHAALLPHITLSAFQSSCSKSGGIKLLKGKECYWAYKLGATKKHSKHINLISTHTAFLVAKQHGAHPATLQGLQHLKDPSKVSIQQLPEELLTLNCTPSVNPSSLKVALPLPTTLPPCPINAMVGRERYGLAMLKPHLAKGVVLSLQLAEFKQWATADYQLDRPGGGIQQVSWENMLSHIMLYLGFCHKYMSIQEPTLQQFLLPHLLGSYVSFHLHKKHSCNTIKHHLQTACKVLDWWATKAGGHDPGLHKLRKEWLPTLSHQVNTSQAPFTNMSKWGLAQPVTQVLESHQPFPS